MPDEDDMEEDDIFDGVETADVGPETAERAVQETASTADSQQVDWNLVAENLEDITNLIREYFVQSRESQKVQNEAKIRFYKHRRRIIYTAAGAFFVVVLVSAGMTWEGALSGDAFTFALGTLFGSILIFLQNMLTAQQTED